MIKIKPKRINTLVMLVQCFIFQLQVLLLKKQKQYELTILNDAPFLFNSAKNNSKKIHWQNTCF